MTKLTQRQQQILDFVRRAKQNQGVTPSLRDIAAHFGFKSMNAAVAHVQALRKKGVLSNQPKRARSLQIISPWRSLAQAVVDVPLYGIIPAGLAEDRRQEAKGCISIDIESLGIHPTARTFALEVKGDSMIGKHILEGDYVVLEHGRTPRSGDIVAALIDNESTLKTFMQEKGKLYLRAENPRYSKLIPAEELVIQGVMVALIRKYN